MFVAVRGGRRLALSAVLCKMVERKMWMWMRAMCVPPCVYRRVCSQAPSALVACTQWAEGPIACFAVVTGLSRPSKGRRPLNEREDHLGDYKS